MLFNVLLLFLVLSGQIFLFFAYLNSLEAVKTAFFEGYKVAKEGKVPEKPRKIIRKSKKQEPKSYETDKDRIRNLILENINAYDGTGIGQKEIK